MSAGQTYRRNSHVANFVFFPKTLIEVLPEEIIPQTDDQIVTIEIAGENVTATMDRCEHVLHHHLGVMSEEIIATEIEKGTVLLATKARSEVAAAAAVIAEAVEDVVGHLITVDHPAERSS